MKASRQNYRSFFASAISRHYVFARSCNLRHTPRIIHYSTTPENIHRSKIQHFSTPQINIPEDQKKLLQPILMQFGIVDVQDLPRVIEERQALQHKVATLALQLVECKDDIINAHKETADAHKETADAHKEVASKIEKCKNETIDVHKEVASKIEKCKNETIDVHKEVARKIEECKNETNEALGVIRRLSLQLQLTNRDLDQMNRRLNTRGLLESIAASVLKELNITGSTTFGLKKLFTDNNKEGEEFLKTLRRWINENGLVEKNVISAGETLYSRLSAEVHGSYPTAVLDSVHLPSINDQFVLAAIFSYYGRSFLYQENGVTREVPFTFSVISSKIKK